jgi:homogentisate 1,2-dioxygenase
VAVSYQSGFGNDFVTEALRGALPVGPNSPQRCPTACMQSNCRARRSPHHAATTVARGSTASARPRCTDHGGERQPGRAGWSGSTSVCREQIDDEALLLQRRWRDAVRAATGSASLRHRLGVIEAEPQEIVVIPRGMRFRLELLDGRARGYLCENYGANFRLPDLGPIGSNGLANPRDFLTPVAAYEYIEGPNELVAIFMGHLWSAQMDHSPFDVGGGMATTRRTSTTCAASPPSARSVTLIPTPRSSWYCNRSPTREASATSTS